MLGTLQKKDGKWVVRHCCGRCNEVDDICEPTEYPLHPNDADQIFGFGVKDREGDLVNFEILNDYEEPKGDIQYAKITDKKAPWVPMDLDDWEKIFYLYDSSRFHNADISDFREWLKTKYNAPVKKPSNEK